MFGRDKSKNEMLLETNINAVLIQMEVYGPDSEHNEFQDLLSYLERLYALKTDKSKRKVSPDTLATVLGNLLGIVIIVAYEQKHVMVSKAKDFILRPK